MKGFTDSSMATIKATQVIWKEKIISDTAFQRRISSHPLWKRQGLIVAKGQTQWTTNSWIQIANLRSRRMAPRSRRKAIRLMTMKNHMTLLFWLVAHPATSKTAAYIRNLICLGNILKKASPLLNRTRYSRSYSVQADLRYLSISSYAITKENYSQAALTTGKLSAGL